MTPPSNAVLLTVENLTKVYTTGGSQALEVLRDVSFTIQAGEFVAIVGESGTGKSTLLHLLGALDRPTSGTIRFKGIDLSAKHDEELAQFRNTAIGFVFQFHHLLPEFSALENVVMPALIQQQPMQAVRKRGMHLLDLMGLSARADHRPAALSGGEKQRVAIARALMNAPDLVLGDEPTGNLDTRTADKLHAELVRLSNETGQTFVLVTHNLAFAAMADRVLRIEHGMIKEVDPDEIATWK